MPAKCLTSPAALRTSSPGRLGHRLRSGRHATAAVRHQRRRLQHRTIAGWRSPAPRSLLPGGGDTNGVADVFVVDLPDFLDADDDTMDDRWETLFGVTDPAADPDGDGQTNAQEDAAGTHPERRRCGGSSPRARPARSSTPTIALANPSPTPPATAVLTFDSGDGTRVRRPMTVPAGRSPSIDVGARPRPRGDATSRRRSRATACSASSASMTWDCRAGAARLRLARRDRDAGAVADVVPRRRLDGARLRPVLPAAEPAGDDDPRHGPLPAAVRDRRDPRPTTSRRGSRTTIYVNEVPGPRRDRRLRRRQRRRADRGRAGDVPQPARPAVRARARLDGRARRRRRRGSWPRARPARSSTSTC